MLIELDGSFTSPFTFSEGIFVLAGNTTIRGLVINNFSSDGIRLSENISENTNNVIEGNFIGTDPSGTIDEGNARGIDTILREGGGNRIGGSLPGARNLISGNQAEGILLSLSSSGNVIENNLIGTDRTRSQDLGNGTRGIGLFDSSANNVVAGNTIAFNGSTSSDEGLLISGRGTGNTIINNSFFSNSGQGIDLGFNDGQSSANNDPNDLDTGANNLQNFPVLTSARTKGTRTTIKGTLNSTPRRSFTIQFFSNPVSTAQGKTFIAEKSAATNIDGDAAFSVRTRRVSGFVTATATDDSTGDTSEFSVALKVKRV